MIGFGTRWFPDGNTGDAKNSDKIGLLCNTIFFVAIQAKKF